MGSFNGVLDQQFDDQTEAANLDTANMEAERRRRALKSQGQSRPFNKNRRTQLKKVINQTREGGEVVIENQVQDLNNAEMTIHDIMSIEKVQATGQKTQR